MTKITIIGDMMCEPLMLKACKTKNTYDFSKVFEHTKTLLDESDFVIGNLETPLAGKEAGYTKSLLSFNTPDEFADAVKEAGIDLILTANNHCLDRGIDGLQRTIRALERKGISYEGTSLSEKHKTPSIHDVNGIRIAVISYTYGTNYTSNHILLSDDQNYVNLLRPQTELYYKVKLPSSVSPVKKVVRKIIRKIPEEKRFYLRKALGKKVNTAHEDDHLDVETLAPFLKRLENDIRFAKENADFVIFCPHVGGQFNSQPGIFSEYLFQEVASMGCDLIVASHPHVVLKSEMIDDIPCFYSLGNFTMSPNSIYLLHDNKPEYGIAVHIYLNERGYEKISFSIIKIIENKKENLTVYPVDEFFKVIKDEKEKSRMMNDLAWVYQKVTGNMNDFPGIQKEYRLY